jgi:RNA polymerase sigma-70 factor (ECF subfamily)
MDDALERWMAGEPGAADELYRRYFHRVRQFAARLGNRLADADDIAQEALVAGLEGLKAGRRPDKLTSWLLGIARHVSSKRTRIELNPPEQIDPRGRSGATLAVRQEMNELLARSLEGLPPLYREVLDLRHRENLSRKEIADRLGVPLDTVHARCERAYARLRECLSRHFTTAVLGAASPVALEAIERLRPSFRDAVVARHLEDLPETAAAARLGIPVSTLRARLESALEMLHAGPAPDFSAARTEHRRARKG